MAPLAALTSLAVPLVLLGAAALCDARERRIPNAVTASLAVTGVVSAGLREGPTALLTSASAVALGLLVLLPIYRLGWMGGGDVKLTAASGAWLGVTGVLVLVVLSALAGGVLSVAMLLRASKSERARVRGNLAGLAVELGYGAGAARLRTGVAGSTRVPYGVAIALTAAVQLVHGRLS